MDVTERLLQAFRDDPESLLRELTDQRAFRANLLQTLAGFVDSDVGRRQYGEYGWIALMPSTLSITSVKGRCNLACRMCGGSRGELQYLRGEQLATMMDHAPTAGLVILVAGDSEPLLNPEMGALLQVVRAHGANANVVTNGHLLTDELIAMMVETGQPASLNVSLDAASEGTYRAIRGASFRRVVARLEALRDAKRAAGASQPMLSLLMVGMEDTISELPAFVRLAAELDACRVHVDHMRGDYRPGDFTRSPGWEEPVMEAVLLAHELGVPLQLPSDTSSRMQAKILEIARQTGFGDGGGAVRRGPAGGGDVGPGAGVPDGPSRCPWTPGSIHIDLDGTIWPCCNVPERIGGIYDGPLRECGEYLRVRAAYMGGAVHRRCLAERSCPYIQHLSSLGRTPDTVD